MPIIIESIKKPEHIKYIGIISYNNDQCFAVSYGTQISIYDEYGELVKEFKSKHYVDLIFPYGEYYFLISSKVYSVYKDAKMICKYYFDNEISNIWKIINISEKLFIFHNGIYFFGVINNLKIEISDSLNDSSFYKTSSAMLVKNKKLVCIIGKSFKNTYLIKYQEKNGKLENERFVINEDIHYVFTYDDEVFFIGSSGLFKLINRKSVFVKQFGNNIIRGIEEKEGKAIVVCRNGEITEICGKEALINDVFDFGKEIFKVGCKGKTLCLEFENEIVFFRGNEIIKRIEKQAINFFQKGIINNEGIEYFSEKGLVTIGRYIKTNVLDENKIIELQNKNKIKVDNLEMSIIKNDITEHTLIDIYKTTIANVLTYRSFSRINNYIFHRIDGCFEIEELTVLATRNGMFILGENIFYKLDIVPLISKLYRNIFYIYGKEKLYVIENSNQVLNNNENTLSVKVFNAPIDILEIGFSGPDACLISIKENLYWINLDTGDFVYENIPKINYNTIEFYLASLGNKPFYNKDNIDFIKTQDKNLLEDNQLFKLLANMKKITENFNYYCMNGKVYMIKNKKMVVLHDFKEYIYNINVLNINSDYLIISTDKRTILFSCIENKMQLFDSPSFNSILLPSTEKNNIIILLITQNGLRIGNIIMKCFFNTEISNSKSVITESSIDNYEFTPLSLKVHVSNNLWKTSNHIKLIYYDYFSNIVYSVSKPDFIGFDICFKKKKITFENSIIYNYYKIRDFLIAITHYTKDKTRFFLTFIEFDDFNIKIRKEFPLSSFPLRLDSRKSFVLLFTLNEILLYIIKNGHIKCKGRLESQNSMMIQTYFISNTMIGILYKDQSFKTIKIFQSKDFNINISEIKHCEKKMKNIYLNKKLKSINMLVMDELFESHTGLPFLYKNAFGCFTNSKIYWKSNSLDFIEPIKDLIVYNNHIYIFTKNFGIYTLFGID